MISKWKDTPFPNKGHGKIRKEKSKEKQRKGKKGKEEIEENKKGKGNESENQNGQRKWMRTIQARDE